jgi:hypothetical protein
VRGSLLSATVISDPIDPHLPLEESRACGREHHPLLSEPHAVLSDAFRDDLVAQLGQMMRIIEKICIFYIIVREFLCRIGERDAKIVEDLARLASGEIVARYSGLGVPRHLSPGGGYGGVQEPQ